MRLRIPERKTHCLFTKQQYIVSGLPSDWVLFWKRYHLGTIVLLRGLKSSHANDGETWRGLIGRNGLPDQNLSSGLLLNFYVSHGLATTNTMLKHGVIPRHTWYQNTLGQISIIDFVVLSSDHWLYVLSSQNRLKRLCQGAGKKALTNCQNSDPGGAMQILFWSWNSGPALYPCSLIEGVQGSLPIHSCLQAVWWVYCASTAMSHPGLYIPGVRTVSIFSAGSLRCFQLLLGCL